MYKANAAMLEEELQQERDRIFDIDDKYALMLTKKQLEMDQIKK
jgi:hypothetical protein